MAEIDNLMIQISADSSAAVKGIDALTASLNKLKSATKGGLGLEKVSNDMDKLSKNTQKTSSNNEKLSKSTDKVKNSNDKVSKSNDKVSKSNEKTSKSYINLWAKCRMAYNTIQAGARVIGKAISESMDYTENLNLFNVAMGEYAGEARKYAEEVGEIMGIDPGEWMRNQGMFMTLATGFGVAGDRANKMSKNLTQLGYDISSLFNLSYEDAMLKLQSGLAGELEPLRRIGYDLSQARLQQEAYTLGINKKVAAMTQAEKAELRYHAIMTQVTTSHGDMARTLDAPANQFRVLKSQVTQAARAIGNMFIPALQAILPIAIAVVKVVRLIANAIASLLGFKEIAADLSNVDLSSGGEEFADAMGDAAKNAKKVKDYTMGIDELNVLKQDSGSGNDDSASLGTGFDFELPEYDFLGDATQSKVNEIVEKMKEWLGLTDDVDTWSEFFDTRLGNILENVGLIAVGLLGWKLASGLVSAIATLTKLLAVPSYSIVIGATLAIIGFKMEFDGIKDAVMNGLNGLNFAEIIGGGLFGTAGAAILGKMFVTWFGKVCSTKMVFVLAEWGRNLGVATTGALGAALGAALGGIVAGIPAYFVGIYDACVNGIDWLSGLLIPAGATAAGAGIGAIIGMLGGPIGAGIGALIGLAVGAVTDLVILVVQKWDEIAGFFVGMWEKICNFFAPASEWFMTYVIEPISNFFEGATTRIGQFFEGCWIIIQAVWKIASEWFNEHVIVPVVDFFKGIWTSVSGFFSDLWEDVKAIWKPVAEWFDTHIITPVRNVFETVCEKISGFFSNLWLGIRQGVAGAMNGVIGAIESAINWVIGGINNLIGGFNKVVQWAADVIGEDWGGVTLVNEVKFARVPVPTYAEGGFPAQGQMFIAREAGAEMVGSIGRKTAVANNDQIVAGIASGVASANTESNALLREQNTLLRAMLEKESGVYLDGKKISKSVEKNQRERGRVLVTGGAY